jgi:hypothetical protein
LNPRDAVLASRSVRSQVPSDIHAQLLQIGRVVAPPVTAVLYAPLQQREPYAGVKVARDERYGPDPRQLLDVFTPEAGGGDAKPVLVYLHGGAFTGGERRSIGGRMRSRTWPPRWMLAYAELDPPDFRQQGEQAHAALCAAGQRPTLLKLMGHSHMSEVYSINTADRAPSDALAAFVSALR